jgi:hypothetical protein
MKPKSPGRGGHWINFNIALFSGYALFSVGSFFWPEMLHFSWIFVIHLATLFVYLLVVFGLATRSLRVNYLVAMISPMMIAHLFVFTTVPLGIQFAYIGPSRSFYTLFFFAVSKVGGEGATLYAFIAFNVLMAFVHAVNICYFTRKKIAAVFMPPGP